MGVPFRIFLSSPRVYTCSCCSAHLVTDEDVISRSFHGRVGRAFLVERATNVLCGKTEDRSLLSGIHKVADLHCRICDQILGWTYIEAQQDSQKYKEGRVLLEKLRLSRDDGWY